MNMRRVTVIYHWEPEGWWAESPDAPGFSAAGDSLREVQAEAHEGLKFYFESDSLVFNDKIFDVEPGWDVTARCTPTVSAKWQHIVDAVTSTIGTPSTHLSQPQGALAVRSGEAYADR